MTAHGAMAPSQPVEHSLFAVPGMRCAGCISKLESGLAPLPGLVSARVNFTARRLAVDHLPALGVGEIRAAICAL